MENIKVISVADERIIHKIYCDMCGKHIADSEEYDDGWYVNAGEYTQRFYLSPTGWFELNKNLCIDCTGKMHDKIIDAIMELGFRKEEY